MTKLNGLFGLNKSGAFVNAKKSVQPKAGLDNDNTNKENDSEGGGIPTKNKNSLKNLPKHSSFYHVVDKKLETEPADHPKGNKTQKETPVSKKLDPV